MSSSADSDDPQEEPGKYVKLRENKSNNDSEDISEEEESDNERSKIREELSEMSFEELMKLKEELGSKVYNEAIFGADSRKERKPKTDFKRANKNRPREMSAKRPVPLILAETRKKEQKVRDPRFDENCGDYNSKVFKENYGFLTGLREKEISDLKSRLGDTADDTEKQNIKLLIQRLQNQNREEHKRKAKEESMKQEQEEIRKAKEEGRQPHYKTKRERKAQELVRQYIELKTSGKLNKYLERRRKKNAAKDRKKLKIE